MARLRATAWAVLAVAFLAAGLATGSVGAQNTASMPLAIAASDTIVRLAVDTAKFRNLPYVTLLDEAIYSIEPDGRTVQHSRQVVQVLAASVVRAISERAYGYASSHQTLKIDWVRVLRPNGEVISDKAAQEQEAETPAAMSNPVYQEQKVHRLSLAGVAAGTIVDVAYTLEERAPFRPGDFLFGWRINGAIPVVRSHLVVDVPKAYTPQLKETNLNFRRSESVDGGRKRYTWLTSNIPAFASEPFASDSNDVARSVLISPPADWNNISKWYDGLARDRYQLTSALGSRVDSLVAAAHPRSRADTIRAVHRWVAQDIRYLSVALGIGGYQPRTPEQTVATGFGDCKDKATLFVAALRRYQIGASPVLLNLTGKPDRTVPTIFQFNHAIAAVQDKAGGTWTFTDLTAEFVPYGEIPKSYQGHFGLIVLPEGKSEQITFPVESSTAALSVLKIELVLDSSGWAAGSITESTAGWPSHAMRGALGVPMDSARRATTKRSLATRVFNADATVDTLTLFDGKDFSVKPELSYQVRATDVLKPAGELRLFPMSPTFRGPARGFRNLAKDLEARPARVFPIDAAQILGQLTTITDVRMTLPQGWQAELPKNVSATSFFGSYTSTWTQSGREVRLVRTIRGLPGVYPSQRIAEVVVWLKTVGADDTEFLSLRPAPVP